MHLRFAAHLSYLFVLLGLFKEASLEGRVSWLPWRGRGSVMLAGRWKLGASLGSARCTSSFILSSRLQEREPGRNGSSPARHGPTVPRRHGHTFSTNVKTKGF